jgi:large subunit ribosomal protein L28
MQAEGGELEMEHGDFLGRAFKADSASKTPSLRNPELDGAMLGKAGHLTNSLCKGPLLPGCSTQPPRLVTAQAVEMHKPKGRRDMLTGQRRNKANTISFSGKRHRKWQKLNIHDKMVYWPEGDRLVKLRITPQTMKTIDKRGLQVMAEEIGLDLNKLPYKDVSPERLKELAEMRKTGKVEMPAGWKPKDDGHPKGPKVPRFIDQRIFWVREGQELDNFGTRMTDPVRKKGVAAYTEETLKDAPAISPAEAAMAEAAEADE